MKLSRLFFLLQFLFLASCQTSYSAKTLPENPPKTFHTWSELIKAFEFGELSIDTMTESQSLAIEKTIITLAHEPREWGRLEYLADHLKNTEQKISKSLSLKLRYHVAMAQKDYAQAEKSLLALINLDPEKKEPRLALGLLYLNGAQFAKAASYLSELRSDRRAVLGLVTAYRMIEDNDRVDAVCDTYRENDPRDWELAINCALFESQNLGAPERALAELERSLSLQEPESEASLRLREMITRIDSARIIRPEAAR